VVHAARARSRSTARRAWDALDESTSSKTAGQVYECANFFSLTLQGERPLVAGISDRLYSKRVTADATEYLHHFLDEENKHMVMFGMFLNRYVGKVYPEKKIALDRTSTRRAKKRSCSSARRSWWRSWATTTTCR
jgi:hypothetical protein